MATQIFYQVRADYAFHFDKRCRLEEGKIEQNALSLGFKIITLHVIMLNLYTNVSI